MPEFFRHSALLVRRLWCVALGATGALLLPGCARRGPPLEPATVAATVAQTSASCRACHQEIHAAWAPTDHACANRPVDPAADAAALAGFATGAPGAAAPEFILGQKPSWQPLVPAPGGRWQPHEQAFDPA